MENLIKAYLDQLKKSGYSQRVQNGDFAILKKFKTYLKNEGKEKPEPINADDIQYFGNQLEESRGITHETALSYQGRVKRFLDFVSRREGKPFPAEKKIKSDLSGEWPEDFRKLYGEYIGKLELEDCPANSLKKVKHHIRLFYGYLLDERKIEKLIDVKKTDVLDYIKYLVDLADGKGEKVYALASVNRNLSDLKTYSVWLSKRGVCYGLSPYFKGLRREEHLSRNILTRKELVRLFNLKAESPYLFMIKTIFVLLYSTGLRINELLGLKVGDIDLDKREAIVYESKTRKERIVLLGETGAVYLKLYLENVRNFIGHRAENSEVNLFLSMFEGKALSDSAVNQNLKRSCEKAGIRKKITCHCFRHSFGTHLLENGAGIKEVSELLGHVKLRSTEHYTRLNPEYLRKTLEKYHPMEGLKWGS